MKLVWSPETAVKAYIDTVKCCQIFTETGVTELLSSIAAGWEAEFIVECYSHGGPIAASVGLAIAARTTGARHVCIVQDEESRLHYTKALLDMDVWPPPEIVSGEAETMIKSLEGLDFLVVDCQLSNFARILKVARVCTRGAVLACKNAWQRNESLFKWNMVLETGTRVVRSIFFPVGNGLDIAYIGNRKCVASSSTGLKVKSSRWIKLIDRKSGKEHSFRRSL